MIGNTVAADPVVERDSLFLGSALLVCDSCSVPALPSIAFG